MRFLLTLKFVPFTAILLAQFFINAAISAEQVVEHVVDQGMVQSTDQANLNNPLFDKELKQFLESLPAVDGANAVDFADIDDKPVIVTFFASWCPPCRDEFSNLNQLMTHHADTDLRVVAINVYEEWDDNDAERMSRFIKNTAPVFPAVVGSEQVRSRFGGIDRIPTIYGFNRDGKLVYRFVHKRGSAITHADMNELEQVAQHLLKTN